MCSLDETNDRINVHYYKNRQYHYQNLFNTPNRTVCSHPDRDNNHPQDHPRKSVPTLLLTRRPRNLTTHDVLDTNARFTVRRAT